MMIKQVKITKPVKADDFLKFVPRQQKTKLLKIAKTLRGKKVVHINATEIGGGVAELLNSMIPYFRALGVNSDWYVIDQKAGDKFFSFTNRLHNALQGFKTNFTADDWQNYQKVNKKIADDLVKLDYDILVINDPQPLFAGHYLAEMGDKRPRIYINHIDTSSAYPKIWKKVFPLMNHYQKIIFSNRDFVNGSLNKKRTKIFTPAIDPLAPKQKIIDKTKAKNYFRRFGLSPKAKLIVQVSRFDIWKNPLGVIEAFLYVQKNMPNIQLALVGFNEAKDNPEADKVYKEVLKAIADKDQDIFLFFNPKGIDVSKFTTYVQNAADIIIQNSTREGFGLTVSEAMWKEKPVIGGPASGVRKQIQNNKSGYIAKTPEELAKKIIYLLNHPKKAKQLGRAAKRRVAKEFLFPRLVLDHFKTYQSALKK